MAQVGFGYGCLCDELEKQANKQGYTLGDEANKFETIRDAALTLAFADILTDTQVNKCFKKINKKVVEALKKEEQVDE